MDPEPIKTIPKLRTFAQDMERARQKNGIVVPSDAKPTVTPKLGAATSEDVAVSPMAAPILPVKDVAPLTSTHLPAFHELQKKSPATLREPTIQATPPTAKPPATPPKRTVSVRAKKQDLKTPKSVGGGTVITDSKSGDFKLFPSILKSISDWIASFEKSLKKKAEPKYVITDTERRRGVIQKATSKTGSIFTADSETLKEEIRRRQQYIPNQDSAPEINWSPNTETGYALLGSGAPKVVTSNVTVEFKKQSAPPVAAPAVPKPVPAPVVPSPVFIEPTYTPPVVPEPAPIEIEPVTLQPEPAFEVPVPPESTPIKDSEPTTEADTEESAPIESYALTTPEAHYRIRSVGDIARINTNVLSIGLVGAIAGLIIFIVVVRAFIGFITPDNAVVSIEPAVPLTNLPSVTDLSLSTASSQEVLSAVNKDTYSSLTELRFVDQAGQTLNTGTLLPLIGFTNFPNLTRSITDLRMVVRGEERALVLTVSDSVTAFGSLLSWEKTLPIDLSAILAINTIDLSGTFSDITISNTDVRVYTTTTGEQRLVYGFISGNTVVITTSPAIFSSLLGSN
jgi:hypothetical protein